MKKILISLLFFGVTVIVNAQASAPVGNGWLATKYLGFDATNGANPLLIKTNNITRMHFNGSTAGYGVITSGFIGIGTSNPAAPLHIIGSGSQNAMGWQRGITLSNAAAIMFDGGGGSGL